MIDQQTRKNFNTLAKRMDLLLTVMETEGREGICWFFGKEELDLIQLSMPHPLREYSTFEGIEWQQVDLPSTLALLTRKKKEG